VELLEHRRVPHRARGLAPGLHAASLGYEKAIIAVGFELLTVPPRR
jgi:hypothetical protein